MKKLILDTTCANPDFDSAPDHLVVELSGSTISRIKSLAEAIEQHFVFSMTFFYDGGEYFSSSTLEELTNFTTPYDEEKITEESVSKENDSSGYIENHQIVVTKSGFKFICTPKHTTLQEQCSTDLLTFDMLDNEQTLDLATL